ncbi:MAG TPA: hypothetical protein VH917_02780, partial [Ignavibacteriaceae bacterium]
MKKTFQFIFVFILLLAILPVAAQEQSASNGRVPPNYKAMSYSDYSGTGTTDAIIAYGHSSINNTTLSMPIPAGTPFTPLSPFTAPNFASSMVKGGDGNYYMTEGTPNLYQVNPGTGAVTLLG